jgi:hypothetical protein
MLVLGKNKVKFYISWLCIPYYSTVICCGPVHQFLEGLKILSFDPKNPKMLSFIFTEKHLFIAKTSQKFIFIGCESLITARLDVVAVHKFLGVLKNILTQKSKVGGFKKYRVSTQKFKCVSRHFYRKTLVHGKN